MKQVFHCRPGPNVGVGTNYTHPFNDNGWNQSVHEVYVRVGPRSP
jgi:hypothetical protein